MEAGNALRFKWTRVAHRRCTRTLAASRKALHRSYFLELPPSLYLVAHRQLSGLESRLSASPSLDGVEPLPKLLAHLEDRHTLRLDADDLATPRVPPHVFSVRTNGEAPETANFNTLATIKGLDHTVEHQADKEV